MKRFFLLILFVISLISIVSLFHPGLPITHDGQDHVARVANFYNSLKEGIIIPRWAANLNWGYGHPVLGFLYPLPSYFASFFHFFSFSLVDSVKIVFGLGMVLSGIFMFLWLSCFLDEKAALIGSLFYIFTPYRFVDLSVRGAVGENFIFIWLPLVLFLMHRLFISKRLSHLALGGISLSFLILSHNAISLMFFPFILFYGIFLIAKTEKKKDKKKLFVNYFFLFLIGFSFSAFFWIPALLEGKYTLRNIVTSSDFMTRFVNIKDLFYGQWGYGVSGQFTVQIGILNLIAVLISLILLFTLRKKIPNFVLQIFLLCYFFLAIFFMLNVSSFFYQHFSILRNFQFPWRFLSVTVFATSVLAAIAVDAFKNKWKNPLLVLIILIMLFLSKDYLYPKGYQHKDESFYSGIYSGTTDTGESTPLWSVRFMEKRPKAEIEVIDKEAKISKKQRTTTARTYEIYSAKGARIMENTLYFPGWVVLDNGKKAEIEFQDTRYRGLITFNVGPGKHTLKIIFQDTKVRQLSNLISFLALIAIISLLSIELRRRVK